jgi:hypothetical protein
MANEGLDREALGLGGATHHFEVITTKRSHCQDRGIGGIAKDQAKERDHN